MSAAWHDPVVLTKLRLAQERLRAASAKIVTHYADPPSQFFRRTGENNKGGARGKGISFRKDGKR